MIAIVDYGAGNLTSVRLALKALGSPAGITCEPSAVLAAEKVILPGVGAAGKAMKSLESTGLAAAVKDAVSRGTPFLGICLGTQIVLEFSEENGGTPCLGLVPGKAIKFSRGRDPQKIPQMGWNTVIQRRPHPLFSGINNESEFYFVHSYYPAPPGEYVIGETEYAGVTFASAIARDNLVAAQFHPEKSGRIGLQMLKNFIEWNGKPC
ncbi:MAG: imidazole glycerol phosphate synthase subunit HisH [Kiritimatiellia bacterium]